MPRIVVTKSYDVSLIPLLKKRLTVTTVGIIAHSLKFTKHLTSYE